MSDDTLVPTIPPLEGCLYCHSEASISLLEPRKFLGLGGSYPVIRCGHCGTTALLDLNADDPEAWRVKYRRVNQAPEYYYVARYLGKAGWLSAQKALTISTDGFVQRKRVKQAQQGELSWLGGGTINPPPPLMGADERVFLSIRAVTYQHAPPSGVFVRQDQGDVLDSGKLYVTDRKIHLLGQRRDWSHSLADVHDVAYDKNAWLVLVDSSGDLRQFRGVISRDQIDPQLVAVVIEALWAKHAG